MDVIELIENYDQISDVVLGKKLAGVLKTHYNDAKFMERWKKVLEKYPNFVPDFDEILSDMIFENFTMEEIAKHSNTLRLVNSDSGVKNAKYCMEFYHTVFEYNTPSDDEDRYKDIRANEIKRELLNTNNEEWFKKIYNSISTYSSSEEICSLGNFIKSLTERDKRIFVHIPLNWIPEYKDILSKNKERADKLKDEEILIAINQENRWILDKNIVTDEEIEKYGVKILTGMTKEVFLSKKEDGSIDEFVQKAKLITDKVEDIDVEGYKNVMSNIDFILTYIPIESLKEYHQISRILALRDTIGEENFRKYIPEKAIDSISKCGFVRSFYNEKGIDGLKFVQQIWEKKPSFVCSHSDVEDDIIIIEKLGIERYITLCENNSTIDNRDIVKFINENDVEQVCQEIDILHNEIGYEEIRPSMIYRFFATNAKENGYIENWKKIKEYADKNNHKYFPEQIDVLQKGIIDKFGLQTIIDEYDGNIIKIYNAGYADKVIDYNNRHPDHKIWNSDYILLNDRYTDKITDEDIIAIRESFKNSISLPKGLQILDELIATNKIIYFKNSTEMLVDFISTNLSRIDYMKKIINENLSADTNIQNLLNILNADRLEELTSEQIDIYLRLKEVDPNFSIARYRDGSEFVDDIQLLNQEYLNKYGEKGLIIIGGRIFIEREYETNKFDFDNTVKYTITTEQLRKLEKICEENPEFKLTIKESQAEFLGQILDLNIDIIRRVPAKKIAEIISKGSLTRWLEIIKEYPDYLPRNPEILNPELKLSTEELINIEKNKEQVGKYLIAYKNGVLDNYKTLPSVIKHEIYESQIKLLTDENLELIKQSLIYIQEISAIKSSLVSKVMDVLKNEEKRAIYKQIVKEYKVFIPEDLKFLSKEYIDKFGIKNIYLFTNITEENHNLISSKEIAYILSTYSKKELDEAISVYGKAPTEAILINPAIVKGIQDGVIDINLLTQHKSPWDKRLYRDFVLDIAIKESRIKDVNFWLSLDYEKVGRVDINPSIGELLKYLNKDIDEKYGADKLIDIWNNFRFLKPAQKLEAIKIAIENDNVDRLLKFSNYTKKLTNFLLLDKDFTYELSTQEFYMLNNSDLSQIEYFKNHPKALEMYTVDQIRDDLRFRKKR